MCICVLEMSATSPPHLPPPSGHATSIVVFFALFLTLKDPDCHKILISSLYHPEPLHKISLQSAHNVLSNVAYKQTDK